MKNGCIVMSESGHDRGLFFVVVGREDKFLLLCDGKNRTLSKPKKKNIRHLKDMGGFVDLSSYTPLYDAHIRKELKCFKSTQLINK